MAVPTPPSLPLRKEVQNYIRSCESMMLSADQPLSAEERQMVEYYLDELKKHLFASQSR